MEDIKKLSLQELTEVVETHGEKAFRAKQIYEWIWKKNASGYDDMKNIPTRLKDRLAKKYEFNSLKISVKKISKDQTVKYAFELASGLLVEGVLIPSKSRITACISTQVGCALKCKFCATGTMGFKQDLSVSEIYEQAAILNNEAQKIFKRKLTNVVLMGMGEPLMNYDNTLTAIDKIISENGLAMAPSRITLSTAGITEKIRKLADDDVKFNLAISLHSANERIRSSIMPINKTNTLSKLTSAVKYFNKKTGSRVTFEYLMMAGINDTIQDAHELADFCKSFPVKINLIEYNNTNDTRFNKSDRDSLGRFVNLLRGEKNMIVNIRKSKGEDIDAACGQLVNK